MLNGHALNTTAIGGASSSVRYVSLVVNQAVRVVGALVSPIRKYGVLAATLTVSAVLSGKRHTFGVLTGAMTVSGSVGDRVLQIVYASLAGVQRCVSSVRSYVEAHSAIDGLIAVAGVISPVTRHQVYLSAIQACLVSGTLYGSDIYSGAVPDEFITTVPAMEVVTTVPAME